MDGCRVDSPDKRAPTKGVMVGAAGHSKEESPVSVSFDGQVTTVINDLDDQDAAATARTEVPDLHLTESALIAGLRTSGTTTSPGASEEDN